jgi:uncharacterized protein
MEQINSEENQDGGAMSENLPIWHEVSPATRAYLPVHVTDDLNGSPISIPVHVVRGRHPGKTLAVVTALHGCEWVSVEIARQLLESVDPDALHGTLVVVPVANPVAFQTQTRATIDESDMNDLNRAFGRPGTWITEQLAQILTRTILAHVDGLIDYHPLGWGTAFGIVIFSKPQDEPLATDIQRMAIAFGYPSLVGAPAEARGTISGEAVSAFRIPAITPEIGGSGFDQAVNDEWLAANVQGALSVMRSWDMLPGEVTCAKRYSFWRKRARVNPSRAGMFQSSVGQRALLSEVTEGQVLGVVRSAHTLECIEELRAPFGGYLYYISTDRPVRPGDWAFGVVADAEYLTAATVGL